MFGVTDELRDEIEKLKEDKQDLYEIMLISIDMDINKIIETLCLISKIGLNDKEKKGIAVKVAELLEKELNK